MQHFPALSALGGPLFVATALFMTATVISLVVSKIMLGHLPLMPFVSGIVVVTFGALGIYLQNETFIKMKPTIINALFGVVLLGGLRLRQIAARLRLQRRFSARCGGLAQAHPSLGHFLPVSRRAQRSRLARVQLVLPARCQSRG